MCVELVVGFPGRDLDDGAQCVGAVTPGEPGGVDGAAGSLFVGVQEPVGESCADRAGRGADRCGSAEGRVGEHQRGEREVVVGVGHDGCGPVDQRPPLAVDEQVERVEIAVADDLCVVRGGGELFRCSGQVVSSDGVGVCGKALEEVVDVGLAGVACEFAVQPVEWTVVECGGGVGEEVGESAQQGGGLFDRGRRAEPAEQRLSGGEVHHGSRRDRGRCSARRRSESTAPGTGIA